MSTNEIENVDLLVVGGGKAGKSLAMERAKAGWKVAMVERQFIGGTCINVACIPTKSLVNSARRLSDARTDEAFGIVGTEGARVDLGKLRAHKEGIVGAMVGAHEKMFAAPGLDFLRGHGSPCLGEVILMKRARAGTIPQGEHPGRVTSHAHTARYQPFGCCIGAVCHSVVLPFVESASGMLE